MAKRDRFSDAFEDPNHAKAATKIGVTLTDFVQPQPSSPLSDVDTYANGGRNHNQHNPSEHAPTRLAEALKEKCGRVNLDSLAAFCKHHGVPIQPIEIIQLPPQVAGNPTSDKKKKSSNTKSSLIEMLIKWVGASI